MRDSGHNESGPRAAVNPAAVSQLAIWRQRLALRYKSIGAAALCLGAVLFALGFSLERYSVQARLWYALPAGVGLDGTNAVLPNATGSPADFYTHNLRAELAGPAVFDAVYKTSKFAFAPEQLRADVRFSIAESSRTIAIEARSSRPEEAAQMAALCARETENQVREFWRQAVAAQRQLISDRIKPLEDRIAASQTEARALLAKRPDAMSDQDWQSLSRELRDLEKRRYALETRLGADRSRYEVLARELQTRNSPLTADRQALQEALRVYTEEHPKVKALKEKIQRAETQAQTAAGAGIEWGETTNVWLQKIQLETLDLRAQIASGTQELEGVARQTEQLRSSLELSSEAGVELHRLEAALQILKQQRLRLIQQQEAARFLEEASASLNQLVEPARLENVSRRAKWIQGGQWGGAGWLFGLALGVVLTLVRAGGNHPIRSANHLRAITGLPILGGVGDLRGLAEPTLQIWAIKTFAQLLQAVRGEGEGALVFGFASSRPREGKTTWIKWLAKAAHREGYSVAVYGGPAAEDPLAPPRLTAAVAAPLATGGDAAEPPAWTVADPGAGSAPSEPPNEPASQAICLADPPEKWHIASRFQAALAQWRGREKTVVFVELPPGSTPESLLMAERVPNLVWVSDCTIANEEDTRMQVATLKDCRCQLIGAVINRSREAAAGRLSLWCLLAALGWLATGVQTRAADALAPATPPTNQTAVLSGTALKKLAPWQERLTLGPGDVLDISIYEVQDSKRPEVAIGPDGRLNYLQARDFPATGLTVDELREGLEKALAKFYMSPRVVINPIAYGSKKFVILGAVMKKGVVSLDRPLTIIEAISLGGGFASSVENQNVATLVDLSRSFIVRRQTGGEFARCPVDFEALFGQGDLSQNIAIEPDDYLYFPPLGIQEVYVVGESRSPGATAFTRGMTVMGAIASRAGYTEKAWRTKVLVIRGSLNAPQTFIVSIADITKGKEKDFALNNRDIIYISRKPWAYAQEILESGINQFLYAAVVGYTGQHVGPWITSPIIK